MTTTDTPLDAPVAPARSNTSRGWILVALLTFLSDFLLWNAVPFGISLGIFEALIAVAMFAAHGFKPLTRSALVIVLLLSGALVQTAINLCFTNQAVVVALLIMLLGELYFRSTISGWLRWLQAFLSLPHIFQRWGWLSGGCNIDGVALESRWKSGSRTLKVIFPAIILVIVFGIILGNGNAILASAIGDAWKVFIEWISGFDFTFSRFFFWLLMASIVLFFVGPLRARLNLAAPGFLNVFASRPDESLVRLQTITILIALNALFFAVNTIDVLHLWSGKIPAGTIGRDYVHEGTNSVITATVLSAVVIAAIFLQNPSVVGLRSIRTLGLIWVFQNLIMIAGVFKRLQIYVIQFNLLTEKRISLGLFLLLVSVGFLFLSLHVIRPDFLRLLRRNVIATFSLFYVVQFFNITGFAAQWNVTQWHRDPQWALYLDYLLGQGPDAWPALARVADSTEKESDPQVALARKHVIRIAANEKFRMEKANWRLLQLQRESGAKAIITQAGKYPE